VWAKENPTTEEINKKLLLVTDKEGWTVWQLVAGRGYIETLLKLWKCAKVSLTTEEVNNKFLLATDNDERTVMHLAVQRGNIETFKNYGVC